MYVISYTIHDDFYKGDFPRENLDLFLNFCIVCYIFGNQHIILTRNYITEIHNGNRLKQFLERDLHGNQELSLIKT